MDAFLEFCPGFAKAICFFMKKILTMVVAICFSTAFCKSRNAIASGMEMEVPDEMVGAWENGSIDFQLWENYREGYYAGRNAVPSREAMVINKDGSAKFYRYEFAFGAYEELIDCEGTISFSNQGIFTFYATKGRKRYINLRYAAKNTDRPLNKGELASPRITGKRAYRYSVASGSPVVQITVPGSAPYNWYRKV
jgi:hypothetical protein